MIPRFLLLFAIFFFASFESVQANTVVSIDQQTTGPLTLSAWLSYTIKPSSSIMHIKSQPDHAWQALPASHD